MAATTYHQGGSYPVFLIFIEVQSAVGSADRKLFYVVFVVAVYVSWYDLIL